MTDEFNQTFENMAAMIAVYFEFVRVRKCIAAVRRLPCGKILTLFVTLYGG